MNALSVIFFGTSEFAVPSLKALQEDERFIVKAIVTQPDRPVGRKQETRKSAVKLAAESFGIQILQFDSVKTPETVEILKDFNADTFVVASFGQIIPQTVLDIPKHGSINVHGSILPKYRGASPVAGAITAGEKETGVTIMLMDAKMDHGPVLTIAKEEIRNDDTTETLSLRLAKLGAEILPETIWNYVNDDLKPEKQNHDEASFVKILSRESGRIDWHKTAEEIERMVRAFAPWPGTFFELDGKRVKILKAGMGPETQKEPGTRFIHEGMPVVACGSGSSLFLKEAQMEGKRAMNGSDFLRGNKYWM